MSYIHQIKGWPTFRWNERQLTAQLSAVRHRQGRLIGRMESLGFALRAEAVLQTLTEDVLKSSEIEGEILNKEQVRSSIARRLGMGIAGLVPADRNVDGVVEMMLDATQNHHLPLTKNRLYDWHSSLFPTGRSGIVKITVGAWRDDANGPMQVISGAIGREKVHYQAPVASLVDTEMTTFLNWLESDIEIDPVQKAAIAHLWFVTIQPFDDGNGRIARAIADLVLARSEKSAQRFYSMSSQIRIDRKAYYETLEATQKGNLDITSWLGWFFLCLDKAIDGAEATLASVLRQARFWEEHSSYAFNERQRNILNRLLTGLDGKLTSSKWAMITKCSADTALRDIDDLIKQGVLRKDTAGGRSTSYSLVESDLIPLRSKA
jgi:Fic family protein